MSLGDLSLGWTDSHMTLDSEESISAAHMLGHLGHILRNSAFFSDLGSKAHLTEVVGKISHAYRGLPSFSYNMYGTQNLTPGGTN